MSDLYSSYLMYMGVSKEYSNWAGFKITFKESINAELLQDIVRRSFARFPYMNEKVALDKEQYVLIPNDKPFVVHTDHESPMDILGPKNDDYQFRMTVWDNVLDARFFHGLCDARGFIQYVKAVLYEYFTVLKKQPFNVPDVILRDSKIPDEEVDDPFRGREFNAQSMTDTPQVQEDAGPYFKLPIDNDPDDNTYSFRIKMDEQQFMQYTKEIDGSPNVIIAILMSRAILSVHPEASGEIVSGIAMDLRTALDRPKSYRSELALLLLPYTKRMEEMSLTTQATCYRGKIFVQSDPDNYRSAFPGYIELYNMLIGIPTMSGKKALATRIINSHNEASTFDVSYAGRFDLGDLEQYIDSFYTIVERIMKTIIIKINSLKGKFYINITQGFASDRYVNALISQIRQAGMSCTMEQPEILVPMTNDIAEL